MTTKDGRRVSVWDYPECPNCQTDVFVSGWQHKATGSKDPYICHFCGQKFESDYQQLAELRQ